MTECPKADRMEAAADEAENDGDTAHAKALRQAALFERRRAREAKHNVSNAAIFADAS